MDIFAKTIQTKPFMYFGVELQIPVNHFSVATDGDGTIHSFPKMFPKFNQEFSEWESNLGAGRIVVGNVTDATPDFAYNSWRTAEDT
ncbi:MAG: hypothetical protein KGM99_15415 [Burkholderiales bacterium]|nr:hypothetical protein [Burkholderiales bacterium]